MIHSLAYMFGVQKRTFSYRNEYLILMDMSYPQGLSVNLM